MSLATIRTAIKTKLEAVTGVEKVLDYVYWTDDWQKIYTNFVANGRVDVWMIGLQSVPRHVLRVGDKEKDWLINLLGYYSIKTDNESSKSFETVIENILNDFSKSFQSISVAQTRTIPPTLTALDNGVYVQTPVHRAQIQFTVNEIINQTILPRG